MMFQLSPKAGLAALVLLACASSIEAHTWTEQLRLIASNGTFVGAPGYQRGYAPRKAGVDTNNDMVYRLNGPNIAKTSPMCKPSQKIGSQTPGFDMLKAAPKDFIAMQYEENGHVTLTDDGLPKGTQSQPTRPAGNGTVFVYGTKKPSDDDTYFGIHRVWNTDGTGGDKRGKLLATRYFDDGQCYQTNADPYSAYRKSSSPKDDELLCQTDIQLPADAGTSGTYTLYWVWEFPSVDPKSGSIITPEDYTACIDISMTSEAVPDAGPFVAEQDVMSKAIEAQLKTAFLVDPTAPPVLQAAAKPFSGEAPSSGPNKSSAGASSATKTAKPKQTSADAAPSVAETIKPTQSSADQKPKGTATAAAGTDNIVTITVTKTVGGATAPASATPTQKPKQSANGSGASQPSKARGTDQGEPATTGAPTVKPFLPGRRQALPFSA